MDNKITFVIMCMILALVVCIPFPANAVKYCVDNTLYENFTIDGTVINTIDENCSYGCDTYTWSTLGETGCKESPLVVVLIGILLIILFILLMRFLL